MKPLKTPIDQETIVNLLQFLLEEARRQSPKEFERRVRNSQFDFNLVPFGNANMMEWRGTEKGLHSFSKFNEIHRWFIADDAAHFVSHFTDKMLPTKKLIIGQRINDAIHILKGLHEKRLLGFYDHLQHIIADHCLDQKEQELDPYGSLKSAVNKNPVIGSVARTRFLDIIIEQIVRENQ